MTLTLKAKIRDLKEELKKIRKEGGVPAVLYGHGTENKNLEISYKEFEKVYKEARESSLIDLEVDGQPTTKVLVQEVQTDPLKDRYLHVDLYQVNMNEEISAEIELEFVGEAPAVKELGGILIKSLNKLQIKCLPGDLINKIEVDLMLLKDFDSIIHVSDLQVPEKIKVQNNPGDVVATVSEPRSEEELKALEEDVTEEVKDVEVEGEKKEGEEGEGEGEAEGDAEAKKEAPAEEGEKKEEKK